jgi:hypothetical protein
MEEIDTKTFAKTTQITKWAVVNRPFVIKKFADVTVIFCHG